MNNTTKQSVILTPAAITGMIVNEIIAARQERGMTQKELEAASGVRQPIIARLEKGSTYPQLSTLLKVLAAFDKTLAIVPLEK